MRVKKVVATFNIQAAIAVLTLEAIQNVHAVMGIVDVVSVRAVLVAESAED